ncbi:hypothetical protein KSW81_002446 [Nannochloris sp. 'desiccata']|nr:hypothetical protein KSW81_002446 [Chlorella desiccata (nom. nud.)]
MIKRVVGVGLLGGTIYVTQDAISDLCLYTRCKALVMERAQNHERFTSALGAKNFSEFGFGPWYDSSVNFSHSGLVASVIRKGGLRWPLLYTLLGGEWEPIIMDAKIGMGAGGTLSSMSLLEQREPQIDGGGDGDDVAAAAAAHPHIKRVQQPQ